MARLRYLQQASDILRRTSRFVTLARRLDLQMNELNQYFGPEVPQSDSKLLVMNRDVRDEADRVLAKGALSLAELCTFPVCCRLQQWLTTFK